MQTKAGRATIKQVASSAGVSTQTVSRVINERPDVSPETRRRVQDVIERMGYQPSALARSLIRQRTHTLGVVTAGLRYIGPSRTLNGITAQAALSHLRNQCLYLHYDGVHYAFKTTPNITQELEDFARQQDIKRDIDPATREELKDRGARWSPSKH